MKRLFVLVALMLTGCYAQAGGGYSYGGGYYIRARATTPPATWKLAVCSSVAVTTGRAGVALTGVSIDTESGHD